MQIPPFVTILEKKERKMKKRPKKERVKKWLLSKLGKKKGDDKDKLMEIKSWIDIIIYI